ncbi:hypothetical protein [Enhygromyxa salina]|nr:hypothetical protein [Enhygromyxa salina]
MRLRLPSSIASVFLVLGVGCGFDSTGAGDSSGEADTDGNGDGDGDPGDGDGDGDPGDGDGDSGDGDGDGDSGDGDGDGDSGDGDGDSGDGDGDTGDGDGESGDGDGDPDPCAGYSFHEIMLASDGQPALPMALYGNENSPPPGVWAQSEVDEEGTITWGFDVECPVEVVMWAVVWDQKPGFLPDDADSFWVRMDGEDPERKWVFGCQTENVDSGWSYQQVSHNAGENTCMLESVSWVLNPGVHILRVRNRESSTFQGAAGIARVLLTSNADYVPTIAND